MTPEELSEAVIRKSERRPIAGFEPVPGRRFGNASLMFSALGFLCFMVPTAAIVFWILGIAAGLAGTLISLGKSSSAFGGLLLGLAGFFIIAAAFISH